jgi:hypothetical protein
MGGIGDPGEALCVLDEHVLKAASSPNQRYVPLASLPYDRLCRLRIAVWGAGTDDDRRSSGSDPRRVINRVSRHDPNLDGDPSLVRCVPQSGQSRAVVLMAGRQINQNRDADGAHQ